MNAALRSFERKLLAEEAPPKPSGAGGRAAIPVGIPADVVDALEGIAAKLGLSRANLARVVLTAGVEAITRELDMDGGTLSLPLRLEIP